MPALPLDEAGKYVAGAYVVFLTLIVVYVAIIGAKVARIDRELGELNDLLDEGEGGREPTRSRRAGGPAPPSERGAGGPAEVSQT
jgi:hypothetical protein